MSHGPGKLQRLILSHLNAENPAQLNALRWQLWSAEHGPVDMEKSFAVSFNRAVDRLGDRLYRAPRKLTDLRELKEYYPFKTRLVQIKKMREKLLGFIEEYVVETGAKFTTAHNEEHLFAELPTERQAFYRSSWEEIERRLFALMCLISPDRRSLIVELVVRAWELFGLKKHLSVNRPLRALIDQAFDGSTVDPAEHSMHKDLLALYCECFPPLALARANLKSQLYAALEVERYVRPRLKEDFKTFLLKRDKAFVEGLPGHQPAGKRPVGGLLHIAHDVQYSPVLDKIVDRGVFARFDFLTIR